MDDERVPGAAGEGADRDGPGPGAEAIFCPMVCEHCSAPGDCEDCLDCLYWPGVVEEHPDVLWPRGGAASPTMVDELEAARRSLGPGVGRRVGLVSRRFRSRQSLTQRGLADELAWSKSALSRLEADASGTPLGRVEELLDHVGYRLALVPVEGRPDAPQGEESDAVWGVTDLLPQDGRGRRPPPFVLVRWQSPLDRRLDGPARGHENAWIWRRPPSSPQLTPPER